MPCSLRGSHVSFNRSPLISTCPFPDREKGLGHDFLSQILPDAPAGKIANERMLFRVQRREALRVIGVLTRGSHREVRVVVG